MWWLAKGVSKSNRARERLERRRDDRSETETKSGREDRGLFRVIPTPLDAVSGQVGSGRKLGYTVVPSPSDEMTGEVWSDDAQCMGRVCQA